MFTVIVRCLTHSLALCEGGGWGEAGEIGVEKGNFQIRRIFCCDFVLKTSEFQFLPRMKLYLKPEMLIRTTTTTS